MANTHSDFSAASSDKTFVGPRRAPVRLDMPWGPPPTPPAWLDPDFIGPHPDWTPPGGLPPAGPRAPRRAKPTFPGPGGPKPPRPRNAARWTPGPPGPDFGL